VTRSLCDRIAGRWSWTAGPIVGVVTFYEGSSAIAWDPLPGMVVPRVTGSRRCDAASGALVISWSNGFTDDLRIAPDAQSLAGSSRGNGAAVTANRLK
jgi:hypothetical protein